MEVKFVEICENAPNRILVKLKKCRRSLN